MKTFLTMAKKSFDDHDGFLNGLVKGMFVSATMIVFLTFLTGYAG